MTDNSSTETTIGNIKESEFALLVEYAYLRDVKGITLENCFFMMTLADYFGFLGLLRFCVDFCIQQILTPDNCVAIYCFLDQIEIGVEFKKLKDAAWKGMLSKFTQIDMGLLKPLPGDLFKRIISDDYLNVKDEQIVWNCMMNWVDHNQNERVPLFNDSLLKSCRLGLLPQNVS